MKLVLFSLLVLLSSKTSWIEAIDLQILAFNQNAVLKKEKVLKAQKDTFFYQRFHYKTTEKLNVHYSSSFVDSTFTTFFKQKDFVFAMTDFYIADYFHKGAPYPNRPKGEITEIKRYFQSDTNGIQLYRTIDYLESSNKDSLFRLLNNQKFDTTFINAVDYQKVIRHYKHTRKHC